MAVTRAWRVYGKEGHRQRESFNKSQSYDWTEGANIRRLEIENADKTGTNEYTIILKIDAVNMMVSITF